MLEKRVKEKVTSEMLERAMWDFVKRAENKGVATKEVNRLLIEWTLLISEGREREWYDIVNNAISEVESIIH